MAEWDRGTPWRQGCFLSQSEITDVLAPLGIPVALSTMLIVASHDCDLAQNIESEPNIEIVVGALVEELDGNFTNTKNPRRLHLPMNIEGSASCLELIASNKLYISKKLLTDYKPENKLSLDAASLIIFQNWLALRYKRSAFAEEFDHRLTSKPHKIADKISSILKPHASTVIKIFFDVDNGESLSREASSPYLLDIYVMYGDLPDLISAEAISKEICDDITKLFNSKLYDKASDKWSDIQLRYCEPISEGAMTYQIAKPLKEWHLEHISFNKKAA